nr:unnamed protein product [Callosobruchus analis]
MGGIGTVGHQNRKSIKFSISAVFTVVSYRLALSVFLVSSIQPGSGVTIVRSGKKLLTDIRLETVPT